MHVQKTEEDNENTNKNVNSYSWKKVL